MKFMPADKLPYLRGEVTVETLADDGAVIDVDHWGENLITNNMRAQLPLLLMPKIITGRVSNVESSTTWRDYRIALIGVGIGNGDPAVQTENPTVLPEHPEDGRTRLIGELAGSAFGLQQPIQKSMNIGLGYSEPTTDPQLALKEVTSVSVSAVAGGGALMEYIFEFEKAEYVGDILELGLFLGTGPAFAGLVTDRLFGGGTPILIARKTRAKLLRKTNALKHRVRWKIRS